MKYVLDGDCGILSGLEGDTDAASYREAECKPIEDDSEETLALIGEAIAARYQKAEDAARTAELGLDLIDANLAAALKDELAAENLAARVTASHEADFARFQAYCKRWELPHLPAPPQAVAVYLGEQIDRGAKHLARLARSISIVHTALNFPDPCADVLVRAVLRLARNDKGHQPEKGNT
jgi:hypothetical protein